MYLLYEKYKLCLTYSGNITKKKIVQQHAVRETVLEKWEK